MLYRKGQEVSEKKMFEDCGHIHVHVYSPGAEIDNPHMFYSFDSTGNNKTNNWDICYSN